MPRLTAAKVSAAILAAAIIFSPGPGRADCSPSDLWNALEGTFNTIDSTECAGVDADPALWAPVGAAAGIMAGVSQSQQFCQQLNNIANQLSTAGQDGNSLVTQLGNLGVDASFLSSVLSVVSSAADALAIAQCACALSNNITQIVGDVGDCIEGAICDLQNLANDIDPSAFPACTGKIIQYPTDCTQNPCDPKTGVCNPNLVTLTQCPSGDDTPPVTVVTGPNGSGAIGSATNGADQNGDIIVQQCVCPPPMTYQWVPWGQYSGWSQVVIDGNCSFFLCVCPQGSSPAGTTGEAQYVCICQNTGQPAQPPIKTTTNPEGLPCPVPLTGLPCPQGQTRVNGQCEPQCASGQILLANGTCCDRSQASSCGTCCPSGQSPDPATGNCVPTPRIRGPGLPHNLR
ncbi:MAG TPA: hypothetical protein VKV77_09970 [Methylovirgula sp.]|nr:hypothetical protein [Methylovirgula sp.]